MNPLESALNNVMTTLDAAKTQGIEIDVAMVEKTIDYVLGNPVFSEVDRTELTKLVDDSVNVWMDEARALDDNSTAAHRMLGRVYAADQQLDRSLAEMDRAVCLLLHNAGPLLVSLLGLALGFHAVHRGWRRLRSPDAMPLDWLAQLEMMPTRFLLGRVTADRLQEQFTSAAESRSDGIRWLFAGVVIVALVVMRIVLGLIRSGGC